MNPLLQQIYATGCVEDASGNQIPHFPASIPYEIGMRLYHLVRERRLQKTLEVGMGYGLSTLFICQAHRDIASGCHIAIDPYQASWFKSIGLLNVSKAHLDDILRFYPAMSCEALPGLCAAGETLDFAFIDGMHLFDYTLVDFFYVDRMLKVGGYVAFDDLWMPALRKVIGYVLSNRSYKLAFFPPDRSAGGWARVATVCPYLVRNPLTRRLVIRFGLGRACLLQKIADDTRQWHFHRAF